MITFVSNSPDGRVLGLGFSEANLQLLAKDQPIKVDLTTLGFGGQMLITLAGAGPLSATLAASVGRDASKLALSPAEVADLRAGDGLIRDVVGGAGAPTVAFLLAGETEAHVIERLEASGLLAEGYRVDGLTEYMSEVEEHGTYGRGVESTPGSWVSLKIPPDDQGPLLSAHGPSVGEHLDQWIGPVMLTLSGLAMTVAALAGAIKWLGAPVGLAFLGVGAFGFWELRRDGVTRLALHERGIIVRARRQRVAIRWDQMTIVATPDRSPWRPPWRSDIVELKITTAGGAYVSLRRGALSGWSSIVRAFREHFEI